MDKEKEFFLKTLKDFIRGKQTTVPEDLDMELRLYQNNEALALCPETDDVAHIMERIVYFDGLIEDLKQE